MGRSCPSNAPTSAATVADAFRIGSTTLTGTESQSGIPISASESTSSGTANPVKPAEEVDVPVSESMQPFFQGGLWLVADS